MAPVMARKSFIMILYFSFQITGVGSLNNSFTTPKIGNNVEGPNEYIIYTK